MEISCASLLWYCKHSFPIPPVEVKIRGVKVPCSMSKTLLEYRRFFSFSWLRYICWSSRSLYESALGWKTLTSKNADRWFSQNPLHYYFPKQCSLIASACWVERVCKSFWQESWRVQVAHLHNAARVQVGVGVFNCQQILKQRFLSLSLILWYKANRMWLSVVCILIDNDTGHHSRQDLLWNHWFIHVDIKQNFHGNLNGFLVTFSTIFTSYLWRVSFWTLWRVWYSSEWHFLSSN